SAYAAWTHGRCSSTRDIRSAFSTTTSSIVFRRRSRSGTTRRRFRRCSNQRDFAKCGGNRASGGSPRGSSRRPRAYGRDSGVRVGRGRSARRLRRHGGGRGGGGGVAPGP